MRLVYNILALMSCGKLQVTFITHVVVRCSNMAYHRNQLARTYAHQFARPFARSQRNCSATVLKVKSRLPGDLVPDDGVEDEEQLAHGCDERHLAGFAAPAQAGVKVADGGVVAGGGHGGHVEDRAHGGAPP